MGIGGVRWDCEQHIIEEAIIKYRGNLRKASAMLGVSDMTMRRRINVTPELQVLLKECRNHLSEYMVDGAEDVLDFAITNREADLGAALKAACFVLNNKGRERGWQGFIRNGEDANFVLGVLDRVKNASIQNGSSAVPSTAEES